MYRPALRASPRALNAVRQAASTTLPITGRRLASTVPADKKRSWKGTLLRAGLAVGAVYWYNTSAIFAEDLQPQQVQAPPQFSDDDLPTVEAVVQQKRREAEARLQARSAAPPAAEPATTPPASEHPPTPTPDDGHAAPAIGGAEALEEEAGQQGAFNPETGEINWDCPCLGGMAHGPCGEEFKAAFSCFVYSKEEPKGMDCIDKFQHMQDCFRQHPEVYGEELADDEEPAEGGAEAGAPLAQTSPDSGAPPTNAAATALGANPDDIAQETAPAAARVATRPQSAGDEAVPAASKQ